jgi:hypothetical protein
LEDKMKKIIIALILLALSVGAFSCGGGAGSADTPRGENGGTPSVVQLSPSHFVAQTNTSITLHAKVLDGNGAPVANTLVTFTNLSSIGVLSSTTARTTNTGLATVSLKSTTDGFSTVQAEVSKDVGQARDRKTVMFSSNTPLVQPGLTPSLTLSVDDGDGIPNETNDFVLTNAIDNQRLITATVSVGGTPVKGSKVTFGADRAFKIGSNPAAICSDGSATCEVIFPQGNSATTNDSGDASVLVEVKPTASSFIEAPLNITALADNGAFNLVTLLLEPVQSVTVSADPTSVASGGTSTITAQALIKGGSPVPDGTAVNFTVNPPANGSVDTPFAQTISGIATAKFTAATVTSNTSATIFAFVGGISGQVPVTITASPPALAIIPTTFTIDSTNAGSVSVQYVLSGGLAPYTVHFTLPQFVDPASPTRDAAIVQKVFTVKYTWSTAASATFQLVVVDGQGKTIQSTVNIAVPSAGP